MDHACSVSNPAAPSVTDALETCGGKRTCIYGPHHTWRTWEVATFEKGYGTIEDASVYFEDTIGLVGGFVCVSLASWRHDRSNCTTVAQK